MQVFYSYSHCQEDKALREVLGKQLAVLRQNQLISEWYDGAINPGEEWDAAIKDNLGKADIILLLVSADFLASKYIWEVELQIAIQRHQTGDARVIPIILRPCDWQNSVLGQLKALPEDGKPITTSKNQDEAFLQVIEGIRQLLSSMAPQHTAQSRTSSAIVITTPPLVKDWVGRSEEITQLQDWITNPNIPLISIQGLGGMGKSTLAAYLFQQFQENSSIDHSEFNIHHFLWTDVTQQPDFTAFTETVLRGLGVRPTTGGDTHQLIQQLMECLKQKSCLLVVDNLESLLNDTGEWLDSAYEQFFSDWLYQGQNSKLLLTTREKPKLFQGLSSWMTLLGLPRSEGGLLLQSLEIQGAVAELEAFAQSVDGHPLTLKLVAGFLREYCEGQLQQVAELGLATEELVYREAEGRHRERQDARISWILEQHLQRLSVEEKQFLLNLSVFRQGFDREAAGWMWVEGQEAEGRSGEQVKPIVIVKALKRLCNRSLLVDLEGGVYQFQLLVQGYLQQREEDFLAAHQQAIAYYRTKLKPEPSDDLSDLNAHLEVFYHYCQRREYAQAYDVLFSCFTFLGLRGYYQTLVDVYGRLTREWQPEADGDKVNQGWSWTLLGNSYKNLGQYQLAIDAHKQANQIFSAINYKQGKAASLGNLGLAYYSLGEYQRAIDYHQQYLEIAREIGDRQGEANSLGGLGLAYYSLGEYQRAIDFHQQNLEIAREIGDRRGEANAWFNSGSVLKKLNRPSQAMTAFENARNLYQTMSLDADIKDCDDQLNQD